MSAPPVAILETGLVCSVGLTAPAACAAIRCAIDNFHETRFMDAGGEWIIGAAVPLARPWRGRPKLVKMLAMAVRECLDAARVGQTKSVPLVLCVAEADRPGRLEGLDDTLRVDLEAELGTRFHPNASTVIAQGRMGAALALAHARKLIHDGHHAAVLIAAPDSLLLAGTLGGFEKRDRLLTSVNSNGFIPGEAAGAVLVGLPRAITEPQLLCAGIGLGIESVTVYTEEPFRADGLTQAIKAALADAGCDLGDLDFRITDNSGEQYYFKEASLALTRTLRRRKEQFHIWHPADCVGEVGAAIGPAILAVLIAALRKGYAPGPNVLFHIGNDAGQRAALVLRHAPARGA
jgi:3-oxoacyl-[acyl-carrier-protein] synthase-1